MFVQSCITRNFCQNHDDEITKEIWDFLKKEYEDDGRIKGMKMLNLIWEFEMQRMKESETMNEYSDRLLSIVNQVRLFD